jgi:ferredoxin
MAGVVFYYTGTGNSLFVARRMADELGDTELISLAEFRTGHTEINAGTIGLVFPVHVWGVPSPVVDFAKVLKAANPGYVFAIAVHAGQVSAALLQLKRILGKRGIVMAAGFEIQMPSNYIPWGGPGAREEQQRRFEAAKEKISRIAGYVRQREKRPIEKGPLWQRIVFSLLYHMSYAQLSKMDRSFRVDDKCNHCGICVKVCPAQNIILQQGKPEWNHKCEQCFACLQWCPQESIQYGKNTVKYARYHHPDVQLKDVLKNR